MAPLPACASTCISITPKKGTVETPLSALLDQGTGPERMRDLQEVMWPCPTQPLAPSVASLLQGPGGRAQGEGDQRSLFQLYLWHLLAGMWVVVQRCVSQGLLLNPGQQISPSMRPSGAGVGLWESRCGQRSDPIPEFWNSLFSLGLSSILPSISPAH